MKTGIIVALAFAALTGTALLAQQVDETVDGSGSHGAAGFGDEAASHEWEMISVSGELEGKLDSKTAKVGDRVVLKTTEKVQTSDGTVIPRGSRLVGRVTQVQAQDDEHAIAQMGILFDRAELKGGQSVAIYTLIRGARPGASAMAPSSQMNSGGLGAPNSNMGSMSGEGQPMGGSRGGSGGVFGASGRTMDGVGNATEDPFDRATANPAQAGVDENTTATVQTAGHGDVNPSSGVHAQAAARAVPHATGIPGVMLAGSSSASGMFSASKRNFQFASGTEMQLGIVADR